MLPRDWGKVWVQWLCYQTQDQMLIAQKSVHRRQTWVLKKKLGGWVVNIIRKAGNLGRRPACVPETNSQVFTIIID